MFERSGLLTVSILALSVSALIPVTSVAISFTSVYNGNTSEVGPAVVNDINGDGWVEALGHINDASGNLLPMPLETIGLSALLDGLVTEGTLFNDGRLADFNNDGFLDLITQGYATVAADLPARFFVNNGLGGFIADPDFESFNMRGHGEGLVVADFNNDGSPDIFIPYYTYTCSDTTDPGCQNSPQAYLLLNNGNGKFTEVADLAGVALRSPTDVSLPQPTQPEGGQAVDINDDGRIDLYIAGQVLLNTGIESVAVPATGGNVLLPRFVKCDCGILNDTDSRVDEGAKFIDWNNDGRLDLVLQDWNNGPKLYENDGTVPSVGIPTAPLTVHYQKRNWTTDSPSDCDSNSIYNGACQFLFTLPGEPNKPVPFQDSFGLNSYDMDNDGLEDIVTAASPNPAINTCPGDSYTPCPVYPQHIFRNTGTGYVDAPAGDFTTLQNLTAVGFGDFNGDNQIDLINPIISAYYINTSAVDGNKSAFTVEVVGADGAQNQFGRVVRVTLPKSGCSFGQAGCTLTRVVDSGSGYHSQSQYRLLIGTPFSGLPHHVTTLLPFNGQLVEVSLDISTGQHAKIFAPSINQPKGHYTIDGVEPASTAATPTPTVTSIPPPEATGTPVSTATPQPTITAIPTATLQPSNTPVPTTTTEPITVVPTVTLQPSIPPLPTTTPPAITPAPMGAAVSLPSAAYGQGVRNRPVRRIVVYPRHRHNRHTHQARRNQLYPNRYIMADEVVNAWHDADFGTHSKSTVHKPVGSERPQSPQLLRHDRGERPQLHPYRGR